MTKPVSRLGRFAVKGIIWRQYLDWAVVNLPFYFYPVPLLFFTLFFFFFAAPARRAVVANLMVVLPGSSRAMNYLRAYRTLYNFAWTISEAAIRRLVKPEFNYELIGAEWLEELGRAQGAIVLTAHMGNYDLGAALFAEKFQREIRIVRAPEPDQETARHLTASLTQAGEGAVKVEYNTAGAFLSFDLLKALRNGEIVSIQGDRVEGGVGETTGRLFGNDVRIPNGPFVLSLVAQAPIYPLFIARAGWRTYQVVVRAPIFVQNKGSREADIAAGVAQWCVVLEEIITLRWDQWFAFVPIFIP
ncbi:MAG TPA: lysophospholipid acyltransferase family protein [Chthoniobacterales bacterium]|jgi:lauroyl/myristoyl acyltransferase|nr:lysophospholipid acyltransferase family protein [Chthoniobacterales bacterium]